MTKEEFKEIILSHTNLDTYRRASMERFIDETDDLTIDNFMERYQDWINSGKNKKVFEQVLCELLDEYDAKIKIGINAIPNHDYTPRNDQDTLMRFNLDSVRCNSTGLYGIITAEGEEVVPCIFESIDIHLDGIIDAVFKDLECTLMTVNRAAAESLEDDEKIILYGKNGALHINVFEIAPQYEQLINLIYK